MNSRRSSRSTTAEFFGDCCEAVLLLTQLGLPLALPLVGGVDAALDEAKPGAGLLPGLLERQGAIAAERPTGGIVAAGIAGDEDEGASAARHDADMEAGNNAVADVVCLAGVGRLVFECLEGTIGEWPLGHFKKFLPRSLATPWQQG
jgi:hypothetical protein